MARPRPRHAADGDESPIADPHAQVRVRSDAREYTLRRVFALSDVAGLIAAYAVMIGAGELFGRRDLGLDEVAVFAASVPAWVLIAVLLGLYHLPEHRLDHALSDEVGPVALTATVWSWGVLLTRAVVSPAPIDVASSLVIWAASIVLILGLRAVVRSFARRRPWYRQRVAVAAAAPADIARIVRRIGRHPEYGLDVHCQFDLSDPDTAHRNLLALVKRGEVQRVIVAAGGDLETRSELIRLLLEAGVHVDLVSSETDVFSSRAVLHYVEGLPVVTFPVVRQTKAWRVVKRAFDVLAASIGLVLLSPLLAYAAIRIRLDSQGPVLYRQTRVGRDGRPFELFKFRTMVRDADAHKAELAELNLHTLNGNGATMFKIERDPRVTEFGAWLRRWSIDELPQLWQVVRGDMSLVGPRPLIDDEAALVGGHYVVRRQMRPGITGPWQTLGRSDIGFDDMVKLDYTYVTNWSFSEDLRLLLRTVEAVLHGRGAY